MLTYADESNLKSRIMFSSADDQMKSLLYKLVEVLATMSPAAADQTVGLASDTLVGTTETITITNGLITAIEANA